MASSLPLPIRIAAGLIATGIEHVRALPQDLPGMSVTLAGQAMRASLRVRQEIAELANRGDELLAPLVERPEEHPAWARFDDEDGFVDGEVDFVEGDAGVADREASEGAAGGGAARGADADGERGARSEAGSATEYDEVSAAGPAADRAGPEPMPGYDELRATQVRARLRGLDAADVEVLLAHERATRGRAAFVTLLENRLATIRSAASGDGARADVLGDGVDGPAGEGAGDATS